VLNFIDSNSILLCTLLLLVTPILRYRTRINRDRATSHTNRRRQLFYKGRTNRIVTLIQLSFDKDNLAPYQYGCVSPRIGLSATCSESRKIILLQYNRITLSEFTFLFNPTKDTLFLRLPMLGEDIRNNITGAYPNLQVQINIREEVVKFLGEIKRLMDKFKNIEAQRLFLEAHNIEYAMAFFADDFEAALWTVLPNIESVKTLTIVTVVEKLAGFRFPSYSGCCRGEVLEVYNEKDGKWEEEEETLGWIPGIYVAALSKRMKNNPGLESVIISRAYILI
jgi:hypothetical protein